jgi:hypothetical protein
MVDKWEHLTTATRRHRKVHTKVVYEEDQSDKQCVVSNFGLLMKGLDSDLKRRNRDLHIAVNILRLL